MSSHLMASPRALREWCRDTCASYPGVDIRNMSTSFRDGLAFCAIIHRHRPDLIDFSSLSKDNVYQNNKLAFETAETKLGIPALLHPNDMISPKVPDFLSIVTYLSQYYHYFLSRKSYAALASSRSPHVTGLHDVTKSKSPDPQKPLKTPPDDETSREDRSSNSRPRRVCHLCFRPVHLIQRHLIDGKVYHRSCFRCQVCRSALLPGSYRQGSDAGFLSCSHHVTDSKSTHVDHNQATGSICSVQAGYFSLGGTAISSIPHYPKTTETQDGPVCQTVGAKGNETERRENTEVTVRAKSTAEEPAPAHDSSPSVKDHTEGGVGKVAEDSRTQTPESPERSSPSPGETGGSSRPVPAPRRMLDPSAVPVPAPRTKTPHMMNSSPASGKSSSQKKSSPDSSHITSPTRVKTNHPWLGIVHPGPWTQLPPAPAPVPTPRSKSVSKLQDPWNRPRVPPPNPFAEDVDSDSRGGVSSEEPDNTRGSLSDGTGAATRPRAPSDETQRENLPRSISVPAITLAHSQGSLSPVELTTATECDTVTSCQSKPVCKENPFDRKPAMPKSKTFQTLSSSRAAPGHGFPLIKRKVQTDQDASGEDLQGEMRSLDQHLEELEQRGVQLERNLRDCTDDKEEEQMLMTWFSLVHERNDLVSRETELVYLTNQQKLEARQADVEYELRCLLIKPENDWSQEDRTLEKQLMEELVSIIEQRNQIVSSLDQDRQREREEDLLVEAMSKNKDYRKEKLKDLKKSKGKFKPTKLFKLLNNKAERSKESMEKKS